MEARSDRSRRVEWRGIFSDPSERGVNGTRLHAVGAPTGSLSCVLLVIARIHAAVDRVLSLDKVGS